MHSFCFRRPGAFSCAGAILGLLVAHAAAPRADGALLTGLKMANHSAVGLNASGSINDHFVRSDGTFFGTHTISPAGGWATGSVRSDETLVMQSTGIANFVGDSTLDVGPAGAISPTVVHTFTHHLELSSTSTLEGFFGQARNAEMQFLFDGVDAANPVYWGIEWTIETDLGVPAGNTSWGIRYRDSGDFGIVTEVLNNTTEGVVTGSAFGSSITNIQEFDLTTANFGNISEIDAVYRIAFSNTPFTDIPDPAPGTGVTPVPTPAAVTGGLIGLTLLALRRRRRA